MKFLMKTETTQDILIIMPEKTVAKLFSFAKTFFTFPKQTNI